MGVDPWATFPTGLASPKPHRRLDPAAAALQAAVQRDGKLRLRHFSRVSKPRGRPLLAGSPRQLRGLWPAGLASCFPGEAGSAWCNAH